MSDLSRFLFSQSFPSIWSNTSLKKKNKEQRYMSDDTPPSGVPTSTVYSIKRELYATTIHIFSSLREQQKKYLQSLGVIIVSNPQHTLAFIHSLLLRTQNSHQAALPQQSRGRKDTDQHEVQIITAKRSHCKREKKTINCEVTTRSKTIQKLLHALLLVCKT